MKTKYIIIILLVLFILVNIFKYKDTFTNTVSFAKNGLNTTLTTANLKIFKNIFNINKTYNYIDTKNKIVEKDILEHKLPKLTFYSYEKCPKLYKLFKGLSAKVVSDINDDQIENVDGLRFRNKIRSAFYNIDRTIKIEHPLIDIERKLMPINIKRNIKEKLDITYISSTDINTFQKYFRITPVIIAYNNLINACNLIFSYLNNRIPQKMSENFIRLKEILTEEKEKVLKLKNIDPKVLFFKDLENDALPSEKTNNYEEYEEYDEDAFSFLNLKTLQAKEATKEAAKEAHEAAKEAREAAVEAATAAAAEEAAEEAEKAVVANAAAIEASAVYAAKEEAAPEILTNTIDKLNLNELEQEYLEKIQRNILDINTSYNYSELVKNIITLESLNEEKNKNFCAILLLNVYLKINVENIENVYDEDKIKIQLDETKTLLEDYKIDNLNLEYKIEDKIEDKIESIINELSKLKTTDNGDSELILDNPNFIFELGGKKINYFTDNHIEQKHKQVSFNVKTDFTEDDVVNFVEYCFNLCCFGAIDIDLLAFTENHYRVLPCFNPIHKSNTHYYILPERIRKVAMEEGKEYTRAKCTGCASNIIIFFDKLPDKFKYYEAIKGEPDTVKDKFINDIL